MLIFFKHPSTPCLYWRPRLYWRPCLYFFNQYIHTGQEKIRARYHACRIDFHQDRANNRDRAYNVSKGAHSVLVLETVLVMETCAYNREYTVGLSSPAILYMWSLLYIWSNCSKVAIHGHSICGHMQCVLSIYGHNNIADSTHMHL